MLKTYYIKRTTKKTIRTILVLGVLLQGIFGSCLSVKATEISLEQNVIVDGSILTDDSISEKVLYNRTRGNILNRGVARITNNGNGSVNVYGAVLLAVKCDTLRLEMTLQRYEGGGWENIKSYSNISSNASLLSKSYNYSVKRGYYYRVKAACIATKNGTSESQMPITNGIWID